MAVNSKLRNTAYEGPFTHGTGHRVTAVPIIGWKVRLTPRKIREMYRTRFGIESSYRQMHEARIKTCTRSFERISR